ncbi:MAG: ribosome biogenesis GTPase Der [Candidatus Aminicenantes bacterium]|nr:ribosome biogenesis GTPase Der [Candidatus Aminicenantes bacterium]
MSEIKTLPRVVIVGYPNAGKSTLFNRLLRQKKALVHSLPGMTRDFVAGETRLAGRRVELVDTGGFLDSPAEPFSSQVKAKAWAAAKSADVVILLLDGQRGLLPVEEDLLRSLRKLGRSFLVAVNKIDTESEKPELAEYYKLGVAQLLFISAEHKLGIGALETAVAGLLPPAPEGGEEETGPRPLRIAVIGRTNVGKSSLINQLCGEERAIVSELPGTTRDSTDVLIRRGSKSYLLVDTAGIRRFGKVSDERESAGVIKARKNIPLADVLCLVLDVTEFPARQDGTVASLALESGKPLVIALNKWDLVSEADVVMEEVERALWSRLDFVNYAPLVPVSAVTGLHVTRILDLAEQVFRNGQKMIGTALLNKFIAVLNAENAPMTKKGLRFPIKYITQKSVLPPTFVAFANAREPMAPAYEKYMVSRIRREFGFEGTPIRILLRGPNL